MTEYRIIKKTLAKEGSKAFDKAKENSCAYVVRGNSIVCITSDGSIEVVGRIPSVRVKMKESDRVVIIN